MEKYYTVERSQQIVLSLLKQHGIRKVIASPGTTNLTLVASMQQDPWFEMYSSVDERSAAYIACGLAAESGEAVVLTCTGATASRNYMPGLTEAYYRKLPILAITATQSENRIGQMVAQVIDRSQLPKDIAILTEHIPACCNADDEWAATIKVNRSMLALHHRGGGPVHINLATTYSRNFSVKELPVARFIKRISRGDVMPAMPQGRIAIWVGAHLAWSHALTDSVNAFCKKYGAVVFCDHCSNYHGPFRAMMALTGTQKLYKSPIFQSDLLIHIGEITADNAMISHLNNTCQVWRVCEDGELRDQFHRLSLVFEMSELSFFEHYAEGESIVTNPFSYITECQAEDRKVRSLIPELSFSNLWIAQHTAHRLPEHSILHLGILNSIRVWNMFEVHPSIIGASNTGGFGIDGLMSTCLGASLAHPELLHFLVIGDLAFFYDLNSAGNRHVGPNLRILLINNGKGTEFRNYNHPGAAFGEEADKYIAAAGHYGNKSSFLIRHYAEDLGYEYLAASTKEEYLKEMERFVKPEMSDAPMIFEVFTDSKDESDALFVIDHLVKEPSMVIVNALKSILPDSSIQMVKKIFKK